MNLDEVLVNTEVEILHTQDKKLKRMSGIVIDNAECDRLVQKLKVKTTEPTLIIKLYPSDEYPTEKFVINTLIAQNKDNAHVWNGLEAEVFISDNKNHIITHSKDEALVCDRRCSKRYTAKGSGLITLLEDEEKYNVELKDISETGMGLIMTKANSIYPGDELAYRIIIENDGEDTTIKEGYAEAVRMAKIEEAADKILLGIKYI